MTTNRQPVRHRPTRTGRAILLIAGATLVVGHTQPALSQEPSSFDSQGTRIEYHDVGSGQPVVLLHGLTSTARLTWEIGGVDIISTLSPSYRVLAPDLRGHGNSGKPHDPLAYGMDVVKDVVRLLDHVGVERAHVAGYSYGTSIALKLAITYPHRVRSLILGGAGWSPRPGATGEMFDTFADGLERGTFGPALASMTPEGQDPPPAEQIAQIDAALAQTNDLLALAATFRAWRELVVAEFALRANSVPTLAIVGTLDPNLDHVRALEGVMANLRVHLIEGEGHISALLSEEFRSRIGEFLAEQAPSSQPSPRRRRG